MTNTKNPPATNRRMGPPEDEIQALRVENERLRHVVSNCAAALVSGAFVSPKATIDFMEKLPKEISMVVSDLRERVQP